MYQVLFTGVFLVFMFVYSLSRELDQSSGLQFSAVFQSFVFFLDCLQLLQPLLSSHSQACSVEENCAVASKWDAEVSQRESLSGSASCSAKMDRSGSLSCQIVWLCPPGRRSQGVWCAGVQVAVVTLTLSKKVPALISLYSPLWKVLRKVMPLRVPELKVDSLKSFRKGRGAYYDPPHWERSITGAGLAGWRLNMSHLPAQWGTRAAQPAAVWSAALLL